MRPKGITDLDLIWAIRDIPRNILNINLKGILYTMIATIGNNPDEWFYHSYKEWSPKTGLSDRSLPRFFQTLEDLGFIFINRPAFYGDGNSNEYKLNYELIMKMGEEWR